MNIENIKELVRTFKNADYKDLFGSLILNEKIDFMQDIEDISNKDIDYLENLYNEFMNNDIITGLINQDILDKINEESEI